MKILSVHFVFPFLIAASLLFIPDAYAVSDYSRISGGQENTSDGNYSTVSGGKYNNSSGTASAIAGGFSNNASGAYSVVGGGSGNAASGDYSTIMGGANNTAAGDYSWVEGKYMQLTTTADRTFVWGYSDTPVSITTPDAFIIAPGTIEGSAWNPKVGIRDINPVGVVEINANSTADDYINIKRVASGDVFIVKNNGYVGIGRSTPFDNTYAMQIGTDGTNGNGAFLTSGGVWTNGSSRKSKENITPLTSQIAENTLEKLNPMTFNYKASRQTTAGFIAEDVPEIVALKNRQALSSMDIIAILTKVSQDQEQAIKAQKEKIERIKHEIKSLKKMLDN